MSLLGKITSGIKGAGKAAGGAVAGSGLGSLVAGPLGAVAGGYLGGSGKGRVGQGLQGIGQIGGLGGQNMMGIPGASIPGGISQLRGAFSPNKASGAPAAPDGSADLQGKLDKLYNESQQLAGGYDPQRLYEEYKQPIESNFYQGANQLSSYLARQGLGSSGMNLAGHAQLEQNRSALESQAQKMAIDQSIQGKMQTELAGLSPELQKYGIDTSKIIAQMQTNAMMDMMQQQMEAGMLGGLGSLAGALGTAAILA